MNKVLKMDFKGETALLSAFVLVGMVFLVPAITENALAVVDATAEGVCGPEGQTHPCQFSLVGSHPDSGKWISKPTESGTLVTWSTTGLRGLFPGDEKGSVTYKVGDETAILSFDSPLVGSNKCSVSGMAEQTPCKSRERSICRFYV